MEEMEEMEERKDKGMKEKKINQSISHLISSLISAPFSFP
jgi:hypothetical protein